MRFCLSIAALLCIPAACAAQTVAQAPQAAPREQALTRRVIDEINNNIACTTDAIALQKQIAEMRDELRKAKEPAEPDKKP